ncbi:hypothetical protein HN748_04960 [Candidatus Peregrinibacteria bacterium]|nr:hypothetical protein [Candidatus Peregrinibacteria bacterium]
MATFFGAPALGYMTGNQTLQKLDLVELTADVLGVDGIEGVDLSTGTTGTTELNGDVTADGAAATVVIVDTDGDGIPDESDACHDVDGHGSADGCPEDRDSDGVYDYEDQCADDYWDTADGCPGDTDGDGIYDDVDLCQDEAAATQDGCPEEDPYDYYDGDGNGHNYGEEGCFPFYDAAGVYYEAWFDQSGIENLCEEEPVAEPAEAPVEAPVETALPDLGVRELYIDSDGQVFAEIKNYGDGPVDYEYFWIHLNIDDGTNDAIYWTYTLSTLSDKDCLDANGTCTINPYDFYVDLTQDHTVSIEIDPYNELEEADDTNNYADMYFEGYGEEEPQDDDPQDEQQTYDLPDLTPQAIYIEDNGTVVVEVENIGAGEVETEDWHIYITIDGRRWTYSVATLSDSIKGFLHSGGNGSISPEIVSTDEDHEIEVQIDPNNDIEEENEDNNYDYGVIFPNNYTDDGSDDNYGAADECGGSIGWEADDGYCESFGAWNWLNDQWCTIYDDWSSECDYDDGGSEFVCGHDGITYDSEDDALDAGTDVDYWGECGVASRSELYEMERSLNNDYVEFDQIISRSEQMIERIDSYIELFERYLSEANERSLDPDGDLEDVVDERTAVFEGYKDAVEEVKDEAESYVDDYEDFRTEAQARYDLVEVGDRGSQYFWDWWQKHDFYWKLRETIERKNDPYDDHGIYDLVGREPIKIAYEAAKQEVLGSLDWSPFEKIEDDIEELWGIWDDIVDQLDDIQVEIVDLIDSSETLSWDEIETLRWSIEEDLGWIYFDIDDYWMAKDLFWQNEPWQNIDAMWQSINWARESDFATVEIQNLIDMWESGESLGTCKDLMTDSYSQELIANLIDLRDSTLLPAAQEALDKAEELQNPDTIWYFFDNILDPTEDYAMPKLEYLSDQYYSNYINSATSDQQSILDEFFGKFVGFGVDFSGQINDVFDFKDDQFDHFMGLVDEDIMDLMIEKIVAHVSTEVITALVERDYEMGGETGLGHMLNAGAYSPDPSRFAEHATHVQALLDILFSLKDSGNSRLENLVTDVMGQAGQLYGGDADALRSALESLDPSNITDTELDDIEALLTDAIAHSAEAQYNDGITVFMDTGADQWFYGDVANMSAQGWVGGYRDASGNLTGNYGPADSVTNAEFLKMASEAFGIGQGSGTPAANEAVGHWSESYYKGAEDWGLNVTDLLPPDDSARRATIAATMIEILDLQDEGQTFSFSDVPWDLEDTINRIAGAGIMTGDDGTNRFRPYDGINRAEVAAVIGRAYDTWQSSQLDIFNLNNFGDALDQFDALDYSGTTEADDWATTMFKKLGTSLLGVMDAIRPSVLMVGM